MGVARIKKWVRGWPVQVMQLENTKFLKYDLTVRGNIHFTMQTFQKTLRERSKKTLWETGHWELSTEITCITTSWSKECDRTTFSARTLGWCVFMILLILLLYLKYYDKMKNHVSPWRKLKTVVCDGMRNG